MKFDYIFGEDIAFMHPQQRLDRNANDKMGKLPQEYIGAFIVKGWNAYITGEDLKILKYAKGGSHPQEFPKVIVP